MRVSARPPASTPAGPSLPGRIVRGLSAIVAREGVAAIAGLRDTRLSDWASRPL